MIQPYFFSVIALFSVGAFILYGVLLIYTMRSSSMQSSYRRRKMLKVFAIVSLVTVSFLVRAVFNFLWPTVVTGIITPLGYYWVFCLPFYVVIELVPTFAVVVVVTNIPSRVAQPRGLPLMAKGAQG